MFYFYIFKTKKDQYIQGVTKNMQTTIIEYALAYKTGIKLLDVQAFKRKKDAESVLQEFQTAPTVVIERIETSKKI